MKRILTITGMMAMSAALMASPLTPEQALKRAQANGPSLKKSVAQSSMKLSFSMQTKDGDPAVYVFDYPDSSGFMIVSGDDSAAPVLGYADSGSFDFENMPPQLEWWLSEYAAQIDSAPEGSGYQKTTRADKTPVSPLVKTKWNQGTPFNNLCPSVGTTKCPSGCVATAMSQVMKYYNYPPVGNGRVTATIPTGGSGVGFISLAQKPFDWDNMLDVYSGYDYTNQQAEAVATLMQAAGYASKMNYSVNGSGALSLNAAIALSKNFKYNPNIQYLQRAYFNATRWEEIIYNELAAGRPVLYGGQSTSVGHEFVCDGYDGNGYYHFNWGWGGMSDGYFLLDALNPDSVGTGGGEGGGYNTGQDIIIGVQPASDSSTPYVTQFGNLYATASGSTLSIVVNNGTNAGYWANAGISPVKVNIGVEITPVGNTSAATQYVTFIKGGEIAALTLDGYNVKYAGYKGNATLTIPSILPNGTYKVTVCSQDANVTDAPWIPVCTSNGTYNFVYITKSGNNLSVQNFKETELSILSASTTTQVYYQNACRIRLSVKNNSNIDLSGGFYPVLFDGTNKAMMGEGVTLSLQPGESSEEEFVTIFQLLDGASAPTASKEYTLKFCKDARGYDFYDWSMPLTLNIMLVAPSFNTSGFCVEGAPIRQETINGKTQDVYVAGNSSDIPFSVMVKNTGSFFGSQVYTLIFNSDLNGYSLTSGAMGPTPILNQGESVTLKGSIDFSEAEAGDSYAAAIFYVSEGTLKQHTATKPIYFTIDPSVSGITDVEYNPDSADHEIYNLQGMPVGRNLESLPAGIYIRNGKKILKRR